MAAFLLIAGNVTAQVSVLDDFEGGTNQNKFLGYWYFYTDSDDGGNSVINNAVENGTELVFEGSYPGGYNGSNYAGVIDYEFGTIEPSCGGTCTYGNMVGAGSNFAAEGETLDLSTATKITVWMKASAPMQVRVEVPTTDILDFAYYRMTADVSTEWTQITVDFTDFITFAQPSWGDEVDFNPAVAEKIQFQISAEDENPDAGVLYIDDIEIHGYVWVPPTACPTIGAAGTPGVGLLLSDMEGEIPAQNVLGQHWFAYNDVGERVVGPGEFTDVFGGVVVDELDPTVIDILIEGNGYGASNGAFIDFQLGPTYLDGTEIIRPFAGVGVRTGDNLELNNYNAAVNGATGIQFDYMTSDDAWVTFEVHAVQSFPNPGIVHHCLIPGSAGTWRSASVAWADLKLPDWDEVKLMPAAQKVLNTAALTKMQWKYQGEPGTAASMSFDNVYLLGAAAEPISVKDRMQNASSNLEVHFSQGQINFNFSDASISDIELKIQNMKGELVAVQNAASVNALSSMYAESFKNGAYVAVASAMQDGKKVEFKKVFSLVQ